jgi:hypothetical protein
MSTAERHLQGMDHSEFMRTCKTLKRELFCETPGKLKTGLRRFHPCMEQPVLQQDNVCALTIARTNAEIFTFISASFTACHLPPTSQSRIFISLPKVRRTG